MKRAGRVSYPRLGAIELARLWLSYQRYGFLLVGASVATVGAVIVLLPTHYWMWALAGLVVAAPASFGFTVLRRWPRKLRATLVAEHRIRTGRFRPESVRAYCGDPCFRVVAREILQRAGVPPCQRETLIRRLRHEFEAAENIVMFVDRQQGTVVIIDGQGSIRQEVRAAPQP